MKDLITLFGAGCIVIFGIIGSVMFSRHLDRLESSKMYVECLKAQKEIAVINQGSKLDRWSGSTLDCSRR